MMHRHHPPYQRLLPESSSISLFQNNNNNNNNNHNSSDTPFIPHQNENNYHPHNHYHNKNKNKNHNNTLTLKKTPGRSHGTRQPLQENGGGGGGFKTPKSKSKSSSSKTTMATTTRRALGDISNKKPVSHQHHQQQHQQQTAGTTTTPWKEAAAASGVVRKLQMSTSTTKQQQQQQSISSSSSSSSTLHSNKKATPAKSLRIANGKQGPTIYNDRATATTVVRTLSTTNTLLTRQEQQQQQVAVPQPQQRQPQGLTNKTAVAGGAGGGDSKIRKQVNFRLPDSTQTKPEKEEQVKEVDLSGLDPIEFSAGRTWTEQHRYIMEQQQQQQEDVQELQAFRRQMKLDQRDPQTRAQAVFERRRQERDEQDMKMEQEGWTVLQEQMKQVALQDGTYQKKGKGMGTRFFLFFCLCVIVCSNRWRSNTKNHYFFLVLILFPLISFYFFSHGNGFFLFLSSPVSLDMIARPISIFHHSTMITITNINVQNWTNKDLPINITKLSRWNCKRTRPSYWICN